jgi:hypothetical protein
VDALVCVCVFVFCVWCVGKCTSSAREKEESQKRCSKFNGLFFGSGGRVGREGGKGLEKGSVYVLYQMRMRGTEGMG